MIYPFFLFVFCSKIIFDRNIFSLCWDKLDYPGSIVYLSCLTKKLFAQNIICYSWLNCIHSWERCTIKITQNRYYWKCENSKGNTFSPKYILLIKSSFIWKFLKEYIHFQTVHLYILITEIQPKTCSQLPWQKPFIFFLRRLALIFS